MKCSSVRERIFDYIDGVLKGSDLRQFEEHLEICSLCRTELEQAQQLDARLKREVPAYVKGIEPSPAFLNRLKNLELEPAPQKTGSFWDSLLGVFREHRMAFGTGLAVILVVALSFAIPTLTHNVNDDDSETIADKPMLMGEESSRAPSATHGPAEESTVLGESNDETYKIGGGDVAAPAQTSGQGEAGFPWSDSAEAVPAPAEESAPMPVPVPTPVPAPTPTIEPSITGEASSTEYFSEGAAACSISVDGEPADESMGNPATIIALNDKDVLAIIEGTYQIEVFYGITIDDYTCDGPTVAITLNEVAPPGNLIYVCVDLENKKVVGIHVCGN